MSSASDPPRHPLQRADVEALLQRHLPLLRAFVRLNVDAELRLRESCSDLVQSVCGQLLEHGAGAEFIDERRMRAWLMTAVLNKIRDRHRHWQAERRRDTPLPGYSHDELASCYDSIASPSQHAIAAEHAARIERAFDGLPEQYREMITLSRLAGLSNAEIAAHLGKTEANVRMLLSRALAKLTSRLEAPGERA